jgi:hypothetical protein
MEHCVAQHLAGISAKMRHVLGPSTSDRDMLSTRLVPIKIYHGYTCNEEELVMRNWSTGHAANF